MNNEVFIRLDADNIGDAIELSLLNDNIVMAKHIHRNVQSGINTLIDKISNSGNYTILMQGCDDILFKVDKEDYSESFIMELKSTFFSVSEYTISIGVATSVQEVLINLRKAKLGGKNRIVSSL
jgi:hypothetical protein